MDLKLFIIKWLKQTGIHGDYFYLNGERVNQGLVKWNDNYYYVSKSSHKIVRSGCVEINECSEDHKVTAGRYVFDADGAILSRYVDVKENDKIKARQEKGQEALKRSRVKTHRPKDNKHYKVSKDRLTYDEFTNYYLSQMWIRRVDSDKLLYDSSINHQNKFAVVNYIRHQCSNYNTLLAEGLRDITDLGDREIFHNWMKNECLYLIADKYPNLKRECKNMITETE